MPNLPPPPPPPLNNLLNNAELASSIFVKSTFDTQKKLCGRYFGVMPKISVWVVDYKAVFVWTLDNAYALLLKYSDS